MMVQQQTINPDVVTAEQ